MRLSLHYVISYTHAHVSTSFDKYVYNSRYTRVRAEFQFAEFHHGDESAACQLSRGGRLPRALLNPVKVFFSFLKIINSIFYFLPLRITGRRKLIFFRSNEFTWFSVEFQILFKLRSLTLSSFSL